MNEIKLTGTVKEIFDKVNGESKKGPWVKRDFILSLPGNYAKDLYIITYGALSEQTDKLQEGEEITVFLNVDSKMNASHRWFTEARLWKLERNASNKPKQEPKTKEAALPQDDEDDLPF